MLASMLSGRTIPFIALLTITIGCERRDVAAVSEQSPALRLGYFANLTHAQAVLGVATGEFEKAIAPAAFSTKVFNAGPSVVEALFAEEIDVAYIGPGPALIANERSKGKGIRVISGSAANGVLIIARKDSGISKLEDLAGKRLATPQLGNTQDLAARHYLSNVLHQRDLSNILPIANPEQAAMLSRGQIDAAWVPEPWGARLVAETGARVIAEEKTLWPQKEFANTLLVTTPEYLAAHPETISKLLAAHRDLTRRLAAEPQRYLAPLNNALAALGGKKLPEPVLADAMSRIRFTLDPSEPTLRALAEWSHELGFSKAAVALDELIDTKLLRSLPTTQPSEVAHVGH